MTLNTYLKNRNLSYGQFAKQIGVSRNAVRFWTTGARRPSYKNIKKIEAETGHLVTARDLFSAALEAADA